MPTLTMPLDMASDFPMCVTLGTGRGALDLVLWEK